VTLPNDVREELRERLWKIAESIDWISLSAAEKARWYAEWTRSPEIGGVLDRYIDKGKVRVYLKDTLLKDFTRKVLSDDSRPLRVLGISSPPEVAKRYVKPHGLRLRDGRIVSWGRAEDWKLILMALYERTYAVAGSKPAGAVLLNATGRYDEASVRAMIENAAKCLGVERVVWLKT
jgi:hypothetical protein